MSTVQEIEAAIVGLAPQEFQEIVRWMDEQREAAWDRRMQPGAESGELDRLWAQAEREIEAGETTALDEFPRHP